MKLKLITFSSQLRISYLSNLVSINVSDSGSKNYSIIQCECDKWLVDLHGYQKPDYYIREMTSRELGNMVYYIDCYKCCAQYRNITKSKWLHNKIGRKIINHALFKSYQGC